MTETTFLIGCHVAIPAIDGVTWHAVDATGDGLDPAAEEIET